jgi:hypothetical protein
LAGSRLCSHAGLDEAPCPPIRTHRQPGRSLRRTSGADAGARSDDRPRRIHVAGARAPRRQLEEAAAIRLLFGVRRESTWFPRDGRFIKSPLRINGVTLSEEERRKAEDLWIAREDQREKRRAARIDGDGARVDAESTAPLTEEGARQALEPGFVSAAYFLRFKFDPGHYALAGRDQFEGRNVLKIEYYPSKLFSEGRTRPNKELRKRDTEIQAKMNKGALVTLWIDPAEHQILKYDFENVDLDFLPGRWLVQLEGMNAAMEMGQPFPSVWLPRSIRIAIDLTIATGHIAGRYAVDYHDYKLATVATRVR